MPGPIKKQKDNIGGGRGFGAAGGMGGGGAVRGGRSAGQTEAQAAKRVRPDFSSEALDVFRRMPTVRYGGQSRAAYRAQERAAQQAAVREQRARLAKSLGRDTKKKLQMDTRWDLESEKMASQAYARRVKNQRVNSAKSAGAKAAGMGAVGAGAVALSKRSSDSKVKRTAAMSKKTVRGGTGQGAPMTGNRGKGYKRAPSKGK